MPSPPGHGLPPAARVSERCYRALLRAYPARFRRAYAQPMALAFRDTCRAAARERGMMGVLSLWPPILWDLVASALAERSRGGITMSSVTLARVAGVAGVLIGVVPGYFIVADIVAAKFDLELPYALDLSWAFLHTWVVPALLLLTLLVLGGIVAHLAPRPGWLAWSAFAVAVLAALVEGAVNVVMWRDLTNPFTAAFWIAHRELELSTTLFAAATIALGILALRQRALPRWNAAPLIVGVLSLVPPAFYSGTVVISLHLTALITALGPIHYGRLEVLYDLALAASWLALGIAVWPRRGAPAGAPAAQPSAPLPA